MRQETWEESGMTAKLIGSYCSVVELLQGDSYNIIATRDNLADAQKILDVLHDTDPNFSMYALLLTPIYESS